MGYGVLGYMLPRFSWLSRVRPSHLVLRAGRREADPAIYLHTLKKLSISLYQALFIDNLEKNIVGAEAVGLHAALFENVDQLQRDLDRRGFPLPVLEPVAGVPRLSARH